MALNMCLGEMEAQSSALTCRIGKKTENFFYVFTILDRTHSDFDTLISAKDNPQQNE